MITNLLNRLFVVSLCGIFTCIQVHSSYAAAAGETLAAPTAKMDPALRVAVEIYNQHASKPQTLADYLQADPRYSQELSQYLKKTANRPLPPLQIQPNGEVKMVLDGRIFLISNIDFTGRSFKINGHPFQLDQSKSLNEMARELQSSLSMNTSGWSFWHLFSLEPEAFAGPVYPTAAGGDAGDALAGLTLGVGLVIVAAAALVGIPLYYGYIQPWFRHDMGTYTSEIQKALDACTLPGKSNPSSPLTAQQIQETRAQLIEIRKNLALWSANESFPTCQDAFLHKDDMPRLYKVCDLYNAALKCLAKNPDFVPIEAFPDNSGEKTPSTPAGPSHQVAPGLILVPGAAPAA